MNARTPPAPPSSGDLARWARDMHNYLVAEAQIKQRVEPTAILLAHRVKDVVERAATDGLLMFDPVLQAPVFSLGGAFVPFGSGGGASVPVIVSPTEPAGAAEGTLWYRNVPPEALFLRLDGPPAVWLEIGGDDTAPVVVGPVAPNSPVEGTLWYSTAAPTGLFIWIDGTPAGEWVEIGKVTLNFATVEDALEGTSADTIMAPATVRALQGGADVQMGGRNNYFDGSIPTDITEIDVILNGINYGNSGGMFLDFAGSPGARAWSSRWRWAASPPAPAGDDNNARFVLDAPATANTFATGLIMLRRSGPLAVWGVQGAFRRTAVSALSVVGEFNMNGVDGFLRFNNYPGVNFIGGRLMYRWRR